MMRIDRAARALWISGLACRRVRLGDGRRQLTNWKFVFSLETSDMMGNLVLVEPVLPYLGIVDRGVS